MTSLKVLKTLTVGKGQWMEIAINEAEPEDSIDRFAIDTYSDGQEELAIPPHWHKNHQEHISVLEGRLEVTIDGKTTMVTTGDPPIIIPRRAVHSMKALKGEKCCFRERPDPPGMYKALFFNDVLSGGGFGGLWHILRAFYDGDAYLALPLHLQMVDEAFMFVFGGIARLFAPTKPDHL